MHSWFEVMGTGCSISVRSVLFAHFVCDITFTLSRLYIKSKIKSWREHCSRLLEGEEEMQSR